MTLLVRDEEDIIAANIEYHLARGVDFIIAMDNLSEDRTPDILRGYERQGCLRYVHQPEDTYMQHRWVTGMARAAATELGADWIINSDADEFWWPHDGDLKQVLAAVDPSAPAVLVERTNFLPTRETRPHGFADAMTVREVRSVNALGAPLPGKVCHRAMPDIDVWQGNHGVLRHGQVLPPVRAPITILHFPMRSYAQFANKIAKGGAAYERNAELPPEVGNTWRELYEVWRRGDLEQRYDALLLDDDAIEAGLRDGRLVRDDRLKTFLASLDARRAGAA